jgi:phage gp29-like protein
METITATVVWSVGLTVQVPTNATVEEKKDAIMAEAMKAELDFKHPVIHDSSDPDCID